MSGSVIEMLAALRRARRLSQQEVADAMGTSQSAVSDLERGEAEPRLSTLTRYAKACGVDLRIAISATFDVASVFVTESVAGGGDTGER